MEAVHVKHVEKNTYCTSGGREGSVREVRARKVGNHYKWIARVRWALEQPSILPFRS